MMKPAVKDANQKKQNSTATVETSDGATAISNGDEN